MPRGVITPLEVNRGAGLDRSTIAPTTGDVTNGHTIANKGVMWVEVHNTNAGSTSHIVSFHLSGGADGQTIVPKPETVAAGKTMMYGPFPTGQYGGNLLVDVNHAELTIAAFYLAM